MEIKVVSHHTFSDYSQTANSAPPNLGLIIVQIRQASNKILDALDEHKQINTRLEGLPDISISPQVIDTRCGVVSTVEPPLLLAR